MKKMIIWINLNVNTQLTRMINNKTNVAEYWTNYNSMFGPGKRIFISERQFELLKSLNLIEIDTFNDDPTLLYTYEHYYVIATLNKTNHYMLFMEIQK